CAPNDAAATMSSTPPAQRAVVAPHLSVRGPDSAAGPGSAPAPGPAEGRAAAGSGAGAAGTGAAATGAGCSDRSPPLPLPPDSASTIPHTAITVFQNMTIASGVKKPFSTAVRSGSPVNRMSPPSAAAPRAQPSAVC